MNLKDSITAIKGIGEKTAKAFEKIKIYTIEDLIEYYPKSYDIFQPVTSIISIKEGETVIIEATVFSQVEMKRIRNLQIIHCKVKDGSGIVGVTWFNMTYLKNVLRMGTRFLFRGKIVRKNGVFVMEQPKILKKEEYVNLLGVLQPLYSLTTGLTNHTIEKALRQGLKEVDFPQDYLPLDIRKTYDLIEYKKAIQNIHFPKNKEQMMMARKRIVFDEFFLFTLAIWQLKRKKIHKKSNYPMNFVSQCNQLIEKLPYSLTKAQLKVWGEIRGDLNQGITMNRLVQGDVGSGKTIIAALAMLMAIKNGYQASIMVPTEVLAKQHFQSFQEVLMEFDVRIILLVGSMSAKEKREAYDQIKNHHCDLIVGTHALIQEKVEYDQLGLVITDEQHRFGVKQREALSNKGMEPHLLVMSATPIPRTLAIILYGDLDLSIIDELPAKRLPIKNCVVNTAYRPNAYGFIAKEVESGRQAYVICPMVEDSESMEAENVVEYTEKLKESLPRSVSIEYLHGKMKAKEKNEIMDRFSQGAIQVLVSTTVVEVGVNVPNATVMMIENAERFGLAQLHQLRGRVGRGEYQSYCILVSGNQSEDTKKRLEILNQSNDGFYIASEDLKLRGPGDVFGIRQSGTLEFSMADIFQDAEILKMANEAAKDIALDQAKIMCKKFKNLKEKLEFYAADIFL